MARQMGKFLFFKKQIVCNGHPDYSKSLEKGILSIFKLSDYFNFNTHTSELACYYMTEFTKRNQQTDSEMILLSYISLRLAVKFNESIQDVGNFYPPMSATFDQCNQLEQGILNCINWNLSIKTAYQIVKEMLDHVDDKIVSTIAFICICIQQPISKEMIAYAAIKYNDIICPQLDYILMNDTVASQVISNINYNKFYFQIINLIVNLLVQEIDEETNEEIKQKSPLNESISQIDLAIKKRKLIKMNRTFNRINRRNWKK